MESLFAFFVALLMQLWGIFMQSADIPTDTTLATSTQATVVRVVDGDTIVVELDGSEETVRYIGIDTPEPYRDGEPACYSVQASDRNKELLVGGQVQLISDTEDRDKYDRLLRYVYVDDVFVNQTLIQEGFAKTLKIKPNTQFADEFAALQESARSQAVGLWGACYPQN